MCCTTSKAVWIFLLPNAVLARHAIDAALRTRAHSNVQVLQLPNSDPKTLWFILMEQLGKRAAGLASIAHRPTHQ